MHNIFYFYRWLYQKTMSLCFEDKILKCWKFSKKLCIIERQTCKKLKHVCTDNDCEYCRPFDVYCKQQSIEHEKTSPKTLHLNGLIEKMNQIIWERVWCMLFEAKLPTHYGVRYYTRSYVFLVLLLPWIWILRF